MLILLAVVSAFLVMILLIKKQVPLGITLLAGGAVVGLLCFRSVGMWMEGVYFALSGSTWELAAIIILIGMIGCSMEASGSLNRISLLLARIFPDRRHTLAFFPAIIGMLNVPGGAIISAPLVDRLGGEAGMTAEQKAAANLLFRHFWFPVYPFYTSMIVITGISGVDMLSVIKSGVPATVVGFLACWHFCFRGVARRKKGSLKERFRAMDICLLIYNLSPVILSLSAALVLHTGYIPSLAAGVLLAQLNNSIPVDKGESPWAYITRRAGRFCREVLLPSLKWQMVIIPVGINFFRYAISGSGGAELAARYLLNTDIPQAALIYAIPFVLSLITGLHLASVTISTPIFLPLLAGQDMAGPVFLILTAATVGYWMSPLHLCLILTNEYMKAGYGRTVKIMFWPSMAVAVAGFITYCLVY